MFPIDQPLVGDAIRISVDITDAADVVIDPADLKIKIIPPAGGAAQTFTPEHDATGKYHYDLTLNAAGTWHWRWETSNPVPAAGEGFIRVSASRFVN